MPPCTDVTLRKLKLPQWPGNYVPLILYVEILFWANALRTHIGWRVVTSVQGGIFADYKQIDTHALKGNHAKFGYPKSLHIWATRDWAILSKLRFDVIYPSVAIRQDWNSNTCSLFAKMIMIIKLNRMLWVWCWKHFLDSLNYISISIDDVIIMFWLNPKIYMLVTTCLQCDLVSI